MGRHAHPGLAGMPALGARLRELRTRAGISQMKLAERLGFDPTHGYKYVLRLEKGLVPNPTLRTVAGFLEACGAGWSELVNVLPASISPAPEPAAAAVPVAEPTPASAPAEPTPPMPRRRDPRPRREQLRSRRIEERTSHVQHYWRALTKAEERTRALLRSQRIASTAHAGYLAYCRTVCPLLDSLAARRPEAVGPELNRQTQTAAAKGLDRRVLQQIQSICTEAFAPTETAG